ncbi:MAG: hypothetical protein L3J22_10640 [Xanthomonadales bacterium]|nr:hypothetical protein [Xanthomonadales bacterium]
MKIDIRFSFKIFLLLIAFVLVTSCGGKQHKISNQPPQIFIANIETIGEDIQFQLQIRNINNIAIPRARVHFEFFFADTPAFNGVQTLDLSLDGRGTEKSGWRGKANPEVIQSLKQLTDGSIRDLDYRSTGEMINLDTNKKLAFSKRGKVFAVPGKPGHFRVAGVSDRSRVNHEAINKDENYH